MNQELKQEIKKVDLSYKKRKKQETKIWIGFGKETKKLTCIVSQEFDRVLKEIELPEKVVIMDFDVNYGTELRDFIINIKGWGVDIYGKSHSDKEGNYLYCAYSYIGKVIGFGDKLDPKIIKFKQDFNVGHISYNCGCGSNHK